MINTPATGLLPANLISALSHTLLHSLWQGVILAALAGLIMTGTRRAGSAMRYNLLLAVLLLFAAGVAITFVYQLISLDNALPVTASTGAGVVQNLPDPMLTPADYPPGHYSWTDETLGFLNNHSRQLVLIWGLIVCMRSLQMLSGLQNIYQLKRRELVDAGAFWQQHVVQMANQLGIVRLVQIAESGLAKVPMVIGHLKPIILMPVGLLTALNPAEVEAIIMHELAHIRRRDYVVNLLQSLLEVLLFFNPAVLWVSALLRTERENCCDDLVLAHTGNQINYIKALVACQEYSAQPALAMAATGKGGPLLNRVNRMLSGSNAALNKIERGLLALALLTAGLCSMAFTNPQAVHKLAQNTAKAVQLVLPEQDKAESSEQAVARLDSAANVAKQHQPDSVAALFLAQQATLPGTDSSKYYMTGADSAWVLQKLALIDERVRRRAEYRATRHQAKLDSLQGLSDNQRRIIDRQMHIADSLGRKADSIAQVNNLQQVINRAYQDEYGKTETGYVKKANGYKRDIRIYTDSVKRNGKKSIVKSPLASLAYVSQVSAAVKAQPVVSELPVNVRVNPQPLVSVKYQPASIAANVPAVLQAETNKENSRSNALISDLLADGLISSRKDLSFKIGVDEFVVNGKKQGDATFRKYKTKYVKAVKPGDDWNWYYNYNTDTGHTTEKTTTVTN